MRAKALADTHVVRTAAGIVEYRETGVGDPVVFVHGIFTNGNVWAPVVSRLPKSIRAIVLDLPLGGQRVAADPDADLSPPALATLLLEVIDKLDLDDITLVANDTGGTICQLAVTAGDPRSQRIGRLLLTNCDVFDQSDLMPSTRPRRRADADVVLVSRILAQLNTPQGRQAFLKTVTAHETSDAQARDLLGGMLTDGAVQRDGAKVLLGLTPEHIANAATHFRDFTRPVRLVWGLNDDLFPVWLAERLQRAFPNAELQRVPDAKLFVSIDQPRTVARAIATFVHQH